MSLNYIRDYEQSSLIAWQGCSLSGGRNAIKGERERQWRHPPGSEFVKPGDSESFGSFSVEYSYDFLRVRPSLRASVHRKWILKFHQFSPLLRPFPSQCSAVKHRFAFIPFNRIPGIVLSTRSEMKWCAPRPELQRYQLLLLLLLKDNYIVATRDRQTHALGMTSKSGVVARINVERTGLGLTDWVRVTRLVSRVNFTLGQTDTEK